MKEERLRSARETAKRPVGGFLLDGFQGGPAVTETRLHLLSSVTAELPEDKPRPVLDWDAGQPHGRWAEVLVTVWCRGSSGCLFHVLTMSVLSYSWPVGKFPSRLLSWFQNVEGDNWHGFVYLILITEGKCYLLCSHS